jgi:methyl-accepting chemotaxis protein
MDGRGEHDGRWNERGERERRASDDRWIDFGIVLIAVGVGYVGRNIGKVSQSIENVSQSIENVSDSIKTMAESINNASAVWEDSNKKKVRV